MAPAGFTTAMPGCMVVPYDQFKKYTMAIARGQYKPKKLSRKYRSTK